ADARWPAERVRRSGNPRSVCLPAQLAAPERIDIACGLHRRDQARSVAWRDWAVLQRMIPPPVPSAFLPPFTFMERSMSMRIVSLSIASLLVIPSFAEEPRLDLNPNDKIVFIGNTLAERETYFGHIETRLHARFPKHKLVVRNLGWSADEITIRLRSLDFEDHGHTLRDHDPDVIFAFFGFNESFAGPDGVETFKADLKTFLADLKKLHYPTKTFGNSRTDKQPDEQVAGDKEDPTIVLFSSIAAEDLGDEHLADADVINQNIAIYTEAMKQIACEAD